MADLGDKIFHLGRAHIRYTRPVPTPILRWLLELCKAFFDTNAQPPKRHTRLSIELPLTETHLALACGDSLAIFQDFPLVRKLLEVSVRAEKEGSLAGASFWSLEDVEAFVRSRFDKAPASSRTMLTFAQEEEIFVWEDRVNNRRRRCCTCSVTGAVFNLGQPESPRTTTPPSDADPLSFYASPSISQSPNCSDSFDSTLTALPQSQSHTHHRKASREPDRPKSFASQRNASMRLTIYEDSQDPYSQPDEFAEADTATSVSFSTLLRRYLREVKSAVAPTGSATPQHYMLGRQQMFSRAESPSITI